jgi:hypothetical protein
MRAKPSGSRPHADHEVGVDHEQLAVRIRRDDTRPVGVDGPDP